MTVAVTSHGEHSLRTQHPEGRFYIERERVDYGGGVSYLADWRIARAGGTPYARGSTAEELVAWAKKNKLKAVVL